MTYSSKCSICEHVKNFKKTPRKYIYLHNLYNFVMLDEDLIDMKRSPFKCQCVCVSGTLEMMTLINSRMTRHRASGSVGLQNPEEE